MSLSVGIVGLPNVGKSTLFNALLKRQVALIANYPFATIEPNVGIAEVPDQRLAKLAQVIGTKVIKPATVEFVDIAGLVAGASQGAGLGNQFLAHIRQTDVICHVLRAFSDPQVIREGATQPEADLQIVRTELQLADLMTLDKQPQPKGAADVATKNRWQLIQNWKKWLNQGQNILTYQPTDENQTWLQTQLAKELCLLTAKPEILVINVDESDLANWQSLTASWSDRLQVKSGQVIVICAQVESELSSLATADQQQYLQGLGVEESGLERLAAVAYATLGLQSFLTAGIKEVRAWTIKQGDNAQTAAGVIHTDLAHKFIKAMVISYPDFLRWDGWKSAKDQGKVRQEGRDYLMQPDDVVEFMTGS